MGAKNLRAIAVRGTTKPEFADPASWYNPAHAGADKVAADGGRRFQSLGTSNDVTENQLIGGLPTRNWTMGRSSATRTSGPRCLPTMMD